MPGLDDFIKDIPPSPEQIVGWCTQYDDPELPNALVAAFQHSNFRRQSRPPLGDKRPAALCPHLHCSKMHSPDDCCICSNQRHPIARCWHIIGLPATKVHMLDQFKAQQASGAGPWSVQSVKALTVEPRVASIASVQTPDPTLCTPNLNESGVMT
jgi:hypothetical protein